MHRPESTNAFGRLADRFVPPAAFDGDIHALRRLRLMARVSLFFLFIPLLPASSFFISGIYWLMLPPAGVILGAAGCLRLVRSGYSPTIIASLIVGVLGTALATVTLTMGGINAPMVPTLLLLSPVASMLSGPKLGRLTAVTVGVVLIAFGVHSDDPTRMLRTVGFLGPHIVLAVLVDWLTTLFRSAIDTEREANEALSQANDNLNSTRVELVRALHARTRLLAVVSHEIRNPISGIMGIADLLRASAESDEQREHIQLLLSSSQTMLGLVNRLLDHAKIDAGKVELERIPFSIPTLVDRALRMHLRSADDRGLQLKSEVDDSLASPVYGDPVRVRQILDNLLSNALKFTDNGHVLIRVQPQMTSQMTGQTAGQATVTARFEVADTGIGLTEAQRATVFLEFAQAAPSTTRKYGGTGLGLSICKKLVEIMDGQIGVTAQPDVGSTFWFTLSFPLAESLNLEPQQLAPPTGATPPHGHESASQVSVLLVEDNPVNVKVTAALLRSLDCSVDIARDGQEAVQALSERDYDLVFMDCHMPVMDGFSATQKIRTRERGSRRTPVIALTGAATEEARRQCLDAGMDECLVKPVARDALKDALGRWAAPPDQPSAS